MILGFLGYRHQVIPSLESLSHSTRAYIINAHGLPGFLIEFDVMKYLDDADKAGQLEHIRRYQAIDLGKVHGELEVKVNQK